MAMTNAERQAAYRERHMSQTGGKHTASRINAVVSLDAAVNLDMLARCYGVTKREVLECALASAAHRAEKAAGKSAGALYHGKSPIKLDAKLLRNG